MREPIRLLAALTVAFTCAAFAQSTFDIEIDETRRGVIPAEHVYVLRMPEGLAEVTIALDGGEDDVDLAVYYGFAEELLFEDYGVEPDPSFTLQHPRPGRYEIHVLNLVGRTVSYELRVTGMPATVAPPETGNYYVLDGGVQVGPLSEAEVRERIARGSTTAGDLVWRPGLDAWAPADTLPELADAFAPPPVAPPPPPVAPTPPPVAPPVVTPAPPVAPTPPPPSGWREVAAGGYCFSVPLAWVDDTDDARRGADGEVLAAWVAPSGPGEPDWMDGGVFLTLLTPDELADGLEDIASDPETRLLRQYGAPLAGSDAVWREYEIIDEGLAFLIHHAAPDRHGRLLAIVGMLRFGAAAGTEADLRSVFASVVPCDAAPPAGVIELACSDHAGSGGLRALSVGESAVVHCPPGCTTDHAVWGTDLYTDDSSVCRAAIHAGVIDIGSGGAFSVTVHGGESNYAASTRFGVTTRSWGSWSRSFTVGSAAAPPPVGLPPAPPAPPVEPPIPPPVEPPSTDRTPDTTIALPPQAGALAADRTDGRHTITIDRAGDLRVTVRAGGDLTIHAYLLDADGSGSLHSQTTGYESERTVERAGLPPGTYHLRVQRTRGEGSYTVEATLDAITTPDDREPNDRAEQAQRIPLGSVTTGRLGYGSPRQGTDTDDWFTITTDRDGDLSVHIEADERLSIHAYLLDIDGSYGLHSQTTGYESERTVERAGLPPGTYYLRVQRTRGHGGYTILPTLDPDTTPGDREPNDSREQAQPIRLGDTTTGRLGYGSPRLGTDTDDWFTITIDREGTLTAGVQAGADLSVHLYLVDEHGRTLGSQTSGYESHRIVERAGLAPGTYYLRVQRTRGHGGYTLSTRHVAGGG